MNTFALLFHKKDLKMGILEEFFKKIEMKSQEQFAEHAVIIAFRYAFDDLHPLYQLGSDLEKMIKDKGVGMYDGHEIAMDNSHGFLYMYGPNAETLFKAVQPLLIKTEFMTGAIAKLRFGPPEDEVSEIEVKLMDN